MKTILLFGGNGFAGTHFKKIYSNNNIIISYGSNLDVCDYTKVQEAIKFHKPNYVINLASISSISKASEDPKRAYEISTIGTMKILSALCDAKFCGTFLFVSSSEVYGNHLNLNKPLDEGASLLALNPYAISKKDAESICLEFSQKEFFKIVIARPFNHIGPGQNELFSVPGFAKQLVAIKKRSLEPVISVGNLDNYRDWTDVRDVVDGYYRLITKGNNGEIYNISSMRARSVRSILIKMCDLIDLKVEIRIDPSRIRSSDQNILYGDNNKITSTLGWAQTYSIDKTLNDILSYWEHR